MNNFRYKVYIVVGNNEAAIVHYTHGWLKALLAIQDWEKYKRRYSGESTMEEKA